MTAANDAADRPRQAVRSRADRTPAQREAEWFAGDRASAGLPSQGSSLYRLLVESVRDYAIFALDAQGRVASWNDGAYRIKGYTAEEILGRHFSTFYPADDIAAGKPPW